MFTMLYGTPVPARSLFPTPAPSPRARRLRPVLSPRSRDLVVTAFPPGPPTLPILLLHEDVGEREEGYSPSTREVKPGPAQEKRPTDRHAIRRERALTLLEDNESPSPSPPVRRGIAGDCVVHAQMETSPMKTRAGGRCTRDFEEPQRTSASKSYGQAQAAISSPEVVSDVRGRDVGVPCAEGTRSAPFLCEAALRRHCDLGEDGGLPWGHDDCGRADGAVQGRHDRPPWCEGGGA